MTAKLFACATQGVVLCFLLGGCQSTAPATSDETAQTAATKSISEASSTPLVVMDPETVSATEPPPNLEADRSEPVDLSIWPTLREGMQLQHALEQTRVQQELRWLRDNPDYLKRLQPRLQKYLPYLLENPRPTASYRTGTHTHC